MKKIKSAIFTILFSGILCAAVSAEEGFRLSGILHTGADAYIDGQSIGMYNSETDNNRIRLNAKWNSLNKGFDMQLRFAAKEGASWGTDNFQVRHAYGWAEAFDGLLRLEAGRLENTTFTTSYQAWGLNITNGINLILYCGENLSIGLESSLMNPAQTATADLDGSYFYRGLNYAVKYETELFFATLGYGAAAKNKSDTLWAEFYLIPTSIFIVNLEGAVENLTEVDGERKFHVSTSFDITPIAALNLFAFGYYAHSASSNQVYAFLSGDYSITNALDALLHVGYDYKDERTEENAHNFFIKPGVGIKIADGVQLKGYYIYSRLGGFKYSTNNEGCAKNKGHSIQLDLSYKF